MTKTKTTLKRDGKTYDLTVEDVASTFGKTSEWVRTHAVALGGRKEAWGDGYRRPATWRFPKVGIKGRVSEVEKQMQANRASRRARQVA